MKKLYEKSEITFAIMWIIIYTVCMGNLRRLGDDSPVLMISLIVVSALMFLCVRITGTMEYYGLTGWAQNSKAMLWFIPLWIISSLNIWGGFSPDYPMPGLLYAAVMDAGTALCGCDDGFRRICRRTDFPWLFVQSYPEGRQCKDSDHHRIRHIRTRSHS